jgi:putative tryptophan/tyrosine transport system substrate-binding protein
VKRREFITLLGGAAAAWPLAARAQQPTMPVIGFINAASAQSWAAPLSAFLKGLRETGYVEGHNVAIEYRWAEAQYDRLPSFVADLVQRKVNVLAATSTPAALAAKAATTAIPIVFTTAGDPVQLGLVGTLSRPGGNITGVTLLDVELAPKRLQLARELMPTATLIPVLVNPRFPPTESMLRELAVAARTLGLKIHVAHATTEREINEAFATVAQLRAGPLVIGTDIFFASRIEQLGTLTLRNVVPTIFEYREFASAGGLISYGASITEMYRNAGIYAGRILKGDKPADLPVQRATKIELIINLKTARALGLTIPTSLLVRADEVIE